jgi:hypothetical protein
LRSLSPHELLTRLEPASGTRAGARDLPARQQTLEATLEWSNDLLERPRRRHWPAGGVPAGCTLARAEGVCDVPLDVLSVLVDHHLVVCSAAGAAPLRDAGDGARVPAAERLALLPTAVASTAATPNTHCSRPFPRPGRGTPAAAACSSATRVAQEIADLRQALDWCAAHDRVLGCGSP